MAGTRYTLNFRRAGNLRPGATMNADDHALGLGRLMGNLQSLEATIRIFLTRTEPSKNYIISRDYFGTVVQKYNDQLANDEPYSIDQQVVTIRNALAHGLVFASSDMSLPLTLYHNGLSYVMTVD